MSSYGFAKSSEFKSVSSVAAPERRMAEDFWHDDGLRTYGNHGGLPVAFVDGSPVPIVDSEARRVRMRAKRGFDIVLSLVALFVLAPLLVFVALAIRATSDGPILFRQVREGYRGRPFEAYKFRTMWVDAGDNTGISQTVMGDKRVTPLGRLLRKSSIDELPQLFNVLFGDMSLVGPRPHVPGMLAGARKYKDLVPYYDARLEMKPGITGWAQANGLRGPTDDAVKAKARIDYDVAYVQNFSLMLDVKIIAMTVKSEFLNGSGS